ncbi:MAG: glycosyltransferase family 4 protein [Candidatus Falkowbacteria bacterium]
MKIAQIVCAFPPYAGGIGNSAYRLEQILQTEHEVHTFHPDNTRPLLRYGHGAFIPALLSGLKNFDLIYLHYPFFGGAEVVWFFKLLHPKTKLIIQYHMDVAGLTPLAKLLSWPAKIVQTSLLKQVDLIVSASLDYIENSAIKNFYHAHAEKFVEIPFSIDTNKFRPSAAIKNPNAPKNILFVGGLDQAHYFKGVDVLLRAVAEIKNINWQLNIVGTGNLQTNYENLAKELNIATQVNFAGKLGGAELISAYQTADLFVLPSINSNEAFGIVLIEAMACGAPVVTSNLPGVRSVFNESCGLTAKPNDSSDLQNKIATILSNDDLQKKMSVAARQLAEEKYSEEKVKKEFLEMIKKFA